MQISVKTHITTLSSKIVIKMSLCRCFSQVKDERLVLIEVLLLLGSKMSTLLVMLKN